jgi:hypothetical protein
MPYKILPPVAFADLPPEVRIKFMSPAEKPKPVENVDFYERNRYLERKKSQQKK